MATVGAYEAKTKFAELLERARKGEQIIITKNGVPVAVLSGIQPRTDPKEAIATIRDLRKGHTLKPFSLRELIEEGRHAR
jgi:prevent-host-death family protein